LDTPDRVASLWRYPVKSMQGEALDVASVSRLGILGDRWFAVVDALDGRVASAKDARRWPNLFTFGAAFRGWPGAGRPTAALTLPNGRLVASDAPDVDEILSRALGRAARLAALEPPAPEGPAAGRVDGSGASTAEARPFVDDAPVHLLTTSTLERLRQLDPSGRFEVPRFRPNVVVDTNGRAGFVENDWVGRTLAIGAVRFEVTGPCPRCAMTTWAQGDLPHDPGILRSIVRHNEANVGVYARVLRGGEVRPGQVVEVEGRAG